MSEQIDTRELRRRIFQNDIPEHLDADIGQALDELDTMRAIVAQEAHDWAEAHDALLAATGTVVDEGNVTGQPTLGELVERLVAERDEARTAARTLFANMPPASISGNIIYDAPRKWQWLDTKGADDASST